MNRQGAKLIDRSLSNAALLGAVRRQVILPSGVEISILDWGGDGPMALLHPGAGHTAGTWALLADALRPDFRSIAIDPRGHGDSYKPEDDDEFAWDFFVDDLVALAEQLVDEERGSPFAVAIGHSMGGAIVLAAVARKPELFERVVVLDPAAYPPRGWPMRKELEIQLDKALSAVRSRRYEWPSRLDAREKLEKRGLFANWDPRAVDIFLNDMIGDSKDGGVRLKCLPENEAEIIGRAWDFDPSESVRGLEVPVCIVTAKQGYYPRVAHEMLATHLDNAVVKEIDCGHLVHLEIPDRIASLVRSFSSESPSL